MYYKIKILLFAIVLSCGIIGCQGEEANGKKETKQEEQADKSLQKSEGVYITYQVIVDGEIDAEMMNDTVNKLQKRAEQYTDKATVSQEGEDCIKVFIPGADDADPVLQELGRHGELYFISETAEDGSKNYNYSGTAAGGDEDGFVWNLEKTIEELVAEGSVKLGGSDIKDAQVERYQDSMGIGNDVVEISLTDEGSKKFEEATRYAYERGETIAIYYDGEFLSVPKVTSIISNGTAIIEGLNSLEETEKLALAIRIGALKCDLKLINVEVIEDK